MRTHPDILVAIKDFSDPIEESDLSILSPAIPLYKLTFVNEMKVASNDEVGSLL